MFKSGGIEDELFHSMKKNLVANQLESQHGFNKLAKAIDYLNAAADIFDQTGLYKEAADVTKVLSKIAEDIEWEDQISGGLADKKTPKDFNPVELEKGVKVEMEHTNDPKLAKEIAMDHLTEDPDYYKKLAKMEKE